jgi:hypothetical protein
MIYASKQDAVRNATDSESFQPIDAKVQIFSPRHDEALFETTMPYINDDQDERFWIAFCIKGGTGINSNGVTVADQTSVMQMRPSVENQCILDKSNVPTHAITAPVTVNTRTVS